MTVNTPAVAPIMSRPLWFDSVPEDGVEVGVEATPAEREALRAFNGLLALEALRAALLVRRQGRNGLLVSGEVAAVVVRTCVVSLDAFQTHIREPVFVHFLQPDALERWRAARTADPADEEVDEPDAIEGGRIDLGALVSEFLALGLDPHPRKPGVRFEEIAPASSGHDPSPFAVLKALRPGDV